MNNKPRSLSLLIALVLVAILSGNVATRSSAAVQQTAQATVRATGAATATAAATARATSAPTAAATARAAVVTPPTYNRTGWPTKLILGIIAPGDGEAAVANTKALREHMEKWLGMPVEPQLGTSYSAVIEALRAGRADGAQLGAFSYILAVNEAKVEPIAVAVGGKKYDPKAQPYYYSVIVTKKGSGINSLKDLPGRSFGFVDPASTSGHLAPRRCCSKTALTPISN